MTHTRPLEPRVQKTQPSELDATKTSQSLMKPTNHRQDIRQHMRTLRNGLDADACQTAATALVQQFKNHINSHFQHIALYYPHRNEISTKPLCDYLWSHNKTLYLPCLSPDDSVHLYFTHFEKNTTLIPNQFGIPEPEGNPVPIAQLDLVCIPLLAFDNLGNRLGSGAGYYDRTFEAYCHSQSPQRLGLAYNFQWYQNISAQSWDVPLHGVLTDTHYYHFEE